MRSAMPTWCFSLVVVRLGRRVLLVREAKHGQLWYLPAGRVEPGETFAEAAVRETLEESGIPVTLEGILRVEHSPGIEASRLRVIFLARPASDAEPKSIADHDSLEARWVAREELGALPLRGGEVAEVIDAVLGGAPVFPLSLIALEGTPLTVR